MVVAIELLEDGEDVLVAEEGEADDRHRLPSATHHQSCCTITIITFVTSRQVSCRVLTLIGLPSGTSHAISVPGCTSQYQPEAFGTGSSVTKPAPAEPSAPAPLLRQICPRQHL